MELGNIYFGNSRGEFEVPRCSDWEGLLFFLFAEAGLDGYGCPARGGWTNENFSFENDLFAVFPYWWGSCECADENSHDKDCPLTRPNFLYKPTGFQIQWYKYPLRDSYSNQEISQEKFQEIIKHCLQDLWKGDG